MKSEPRSREVAKRNSPQISRIAQICFLLASGFWLLASGFFFSTPGFFFQSCPPGGERLANSRIAVLVFYTGS